MDVTTVIHFIIDGEKTDKLRVTAYPSDKQILLERKFDYEKSGFSFSADDIPSLIAQLKEAQELIKANHKETTLRQPIRTYGDEDE